ncbi:MAG: hypothetical protein LBI33_09680, partial [Propionibacteriaceae bacterium]|nr:hypothetical protein [Propionibacteriaceae bacterium]
YCAGTPALDGYALVAGTGATGARIEGGEVAAVADGLGWLVGDVGSGFWIGHQVVRAAFAGLDGRGPRTALSERVLADLGLAEDGRRDEFGRPWVMAPALRQVYALRPVEVSRFAHLAFADDDPVAQGIVAAAASGLAATLATVADARVRGPLVLAGGVVSRHPRLVQTIAATCADTLPATDYLTQSDGTTGAAVLALREAGDTVDAHVFDVITATLTSLRAPGTV